MDEDYKNEIKAIIKKSGKSITEAAAELGMSEAILRTRINSRKYLELDELAQFCQLFKVKYFEVYPGLDKLIN